VVFYFKLGTILARNQGVLELAELQQQSRRSLAECSVSKCSNWWSRHSTIKYLINQKK